MKGRSGSRWSLDSMFRTRVAPHGEVSRSFTNMSCGWIPGPITWTTFHSGRRGYASWTVLMRRTCSHSQQGALTLVKRTISGNVRCASIFSFWAKLSGGLSRFATAPIYVQTVNFVDTRMRWLTTASTEDRGSVVPSADQSPARCAR